LLLCCSKSAFLFPLSPVPRLLIIAYRRWLPNLGMKLAAVCLILALAILECKGQTCSAFVGYPEQQIFDAFVACASSGQCTDLGLLDCIGTQLPGIDVYSKYCLAFYGDQCDALGAVGACCTACPNSPTISYGLLGSRIWFMNLNLFDHCSEDLAEILYQLYGKTGVCAFYSFPGDECTGSFPPLPQMQRCCDATCGSQCTPNLFHTQGVPPIYDFHCTGDECERCNPDSLTCYDPPVPPPVLPPTAPAPIAPPTTPPPISPPLSTLFFSVFCAQRRLTITYTGKIRCSASLCPAKSFM